MNEILSYTSEISNGSNQEKNENDVSVTKTEADIISHENKLHSDTLYVLDNIRNIILVKPYTIISKKFHCSCIKLVTKKYSICL